MNEQERKVKNNLPTGKVDRLIRFGGLRYSTFAYFSLIARIETVYCNILSEEYIVALGPNIVHQICQTLKTNDTLMDLFVGFVPREVSSREFTEITDFVLSVYARMRGKDFAMRLLKKNNSLKLPVRQIQAVLSDPRNRTKKECVRSADDIAAGNELCALVVEIENEEGDDE